MATVREGNKSTLIVVDVQVGVMNEAWDAPRIIGNVARAVEAARTSGTGVIWVQHSDEELVRDSADWQLVPALIPVPGEPIIHKQFQSAFEETNLERELEAYGTTRIVLSGAATNWCIRATAYGALDRGYDVTLISDAHSTGDINLGDGDTIPASHIVTELNAVMQWLSYPGRTCGTAAVADVAWGG